MPISIKHNLDILFVLGMQRKGGDGMTWSNSMTTNKVTKVEGVTGGAIFSSSTVQVFGNVQLQAKTEDGMAWQTEAAQS